MTAEAVAIAVAPAGVSGVLLAMIERLQAGGITVHIADDLGSAAELAGRAPIGPPALLVDLQSLQAGAEIEELEAAAQRIRRAALAVPYTLPIAVTGAADAAIVVACIRAGAGDVIDISLEGTANARAVVQRTFQRQLERAYEVTTARTLRTMIEDLLKDLIRTERRSIDLEEKLAHFESITGEASDVRDVRPPTILIIDDERPVADELAERLETAGVSTYAYTSGEDATRELDGLLASGSGVESIDLALVAAQLPGIDGLETIRRLRERIPALPAFLLTAVSDAELAARAADLGVVGFVRKPLVSVDDVVARLATLAAESLERTREQLYLARIKARHERVLVRYRSLPREP